MPSSIPIFTSLRLANKAGGLASAKRCDHFLANLSASVPSLSTTLTKLIWPGVPLIFSANAMGTYKRGHGRAAHGTRTGTARAQRRHVARPD